jgi:mono/diheme cytochrome c family protein
MKTVLLTLATAAALAVLGAALFVWSGVYDVSAVSPHLQPVYSTIERTMHQSVRLRARDIEAPAGLDTDAARLQRGAACFRDKCEQCHGGPGVAPREMALAMQPLPGPLADAARKWKAGELYWITRHGIKMSGMPAWQHRLPDEDLWALVAFMRRLPDMSPHDYRELMAAQDRRPCIGGAARTDPPDATRGRAALNQNGCNGCHVIPGVTGAQVHVGPPLAGMGRRELIAGTLPNTPAQMAHWILAPHAVDPETAMPALAVSERDAHDIAAYLATLK